LKSTILIIYSFYKQMVKIVATYGIIFYIFMIL
jgi:hypothetical protein